jgi:hypothetical protein
MAGMKSRAQRNEQIFQAVQGWRHWVGNAMLDQLGVEDADGPRDERCRKRLALADAEAIATMVEFFELDRKPDANEVWSEPGFRLFVSHVSDAKARAKEMAEMLGQFGIVPFLAHDTIKPMRIWQDVLRAGLDSMDALLSFHSAGFNVSEWCGQEVGWALGRGVPVIPVMEIENPAGFLGATQAITWNAAADAKAKQKTAETIFDALAAHNDARLRLADELSRNLKFVGTFDSADFAISKLEDLGVLSESGRRNVELADLLNDQVRGRTEGLLGEVVEVA